VLYLDTSALLKRYVPEPESDACEALMRSQPTWVSARHTLVEVRRSLRRLLPDRPHAGALTSFTDDWNHIHIVELDKTTCDSAALIAELTGARTLDALHLAAASRLGPTSRLLTYDVRLAFAARQLGLSVVGV